MTGKELSPEYIRSLDISELEELSQELRNELIERIASSGGHFASSLGATELTLALHYVFDTPKDKLVWDVGHQAYIHKMLTGRRDKINNIRIKDGISGFLKREESEFDSFGAGHAGTSISAAVGMAVAFNHKQSNQKAVAIIGDGSMTAGMAFEALNNAGGLGLKNLVVVLNDNEMSISPNVGAISWLFSRAATSKLSNRLRRKFKKLYNQGLIPHVIYQALDRIEELTQGFMSAPALLFEALGFRYIGPVDGHNLYDLVKALEHAKTQDVPVLVHVATEKGKGYEPAEDDPVKWHGVTPFNKDKGVFNTSAPSTASYTKIFSDALIELAKANSDIHAITAAMPGGTGLDNFQKFFPERFHDVGICEQHAVTFAAGLACEGIKPVCTIYSTFMQRAFDQIIHDVCIQNLPVVFAMDRAGVVGNDGETHQGLFDITYLRTIPGITLMAPRNENLLRHMLYTALNLNSPVAIRYPRGNCLGLPLEQTFKIIEPGTAEITHQGEDILLISYGTIHQQAEKLAQKLAESHKLSCQIIDARFAKPLDKKLLETELSKDYSVIAVLEDHYTTAGFASAILELKNELKINKNILTFGIIDNFVSHASQAEQHRLYGLDLDNMLESILSELQTTNKNTRLRVSNS